MMKPISSENPFQAPISINSNQFGLFNKQDQLSNQPEQENITQPIIIENQDQAEKQEEDNKIREDASDPPSPNNNLMKVKVNNMEDIVNADTQLEVRRDSQHYVEELK